MPNLQFCRSLLKDGGQGGCPAQADANQMDAYEQEAVSLRRQHFIQPSLVPARPG